MRIYISADMEGVAGIVHWEQVDASSAEYGWARRLMVAEVNALVAGAFAGGATEVVVNDSHWHMRNLLPLELDDRVRLITGTWKPLSMLEGLQDGPFAAAFFAGYHGAAGEDGVLAHTYSSKTIHRVTLNGAPAGETTINAALAGALGVPVALVTGDAAAAAEAARLPGTEAVCVKEARSRQSALHLHPAAARRLLEEAAARAARRAQAGELRPWLPPPPHRFEVTFRHAGFAAAAALLPGSVRLDPVTVAWEGEDYVTAFRAFRTMVILAAAFE